MDTKTKLVCLAIGTILSSSAVFAQQGTIINAPKGGDETNYGFQTGTVQGYGKFGGLYSSGEGGLHPAFGAGLEVGLHKYIGLFADFGYSRVLNESMTGCYYASCATIKAKANLVTAGGGFEVVGTNRSRAVPYGRIGAGYARGAGSALGYSVSLGAPTILGGGGVKVYFNRHFGIDGGVMYFRTVGNNSGGNLFQPTVGVFVQSR